MDCQACRLNELQQHSNKQLEEIRELKSRLTLIEHENLRLKEYPVFTLARLQVQQKEWTAHNFPEQPSWHSLLGAIEELGELAHSHLKDCQNIRSTDSRIEQKKDAIADVIIFLCGYASGEGIDLQDAVTEVWNNVKKRDWIKFPKDGERE